MMIWLPPPPSPWPGCAGTATNTNEWNKSCPRYATIARSRHLTFTRLLEITSCHGTHQTEHMEHWHTTTRTATMFAWLAQRHSLPRPAQAQLGQTLCWVRTPVVFWLEDLGPLNIPWFDDLIWDSVSWADGRGREVGRGGEEGGGGGRTCCIVLVYWTTGVTPAGQASKYWLILTGDHTTPG